MLALPLHEDKENVFDVATREIGRFNAAKV